MLVCRLKELIEMKIITLYELSKKSGVKLSTLEKYYNNTIKRINFGTLDKLYKTLNCETEDLFIRKSTLQNI